MAISERDAMTPQDFHYFEQITHKRISGMPALFLDRDGVLINDVGYLKSPSSVSLVDGAAALVRAANDADVPAIVVTNQSGIGRSLFCIEDFLSVNAWMQKLIAAETGGRLDAIFACTAPPPDRNRGDPWRKPNPGMFFASKEILGTALHRSWMIGDRLTDIRAAYRAGLGGAMLLPKNFSASRYKNNKFMKVLAISSLYDAMQTVISIKT